MIQDMKPFILAALEQEKQDMSKDEFGMDTSLTSLSWLQKLNCTTGLNKVLKTPTTAPPPRLSLQRDVTSGAWKAPQSLLDQLPSVKEMDIAIKKDHNIDPNIDWTTTIDPKPPHNFATLIYMAMRENPIAKVSLNDIYRYIMKYFKYYRTADPVWKNTIRHSLTQNKFFKKTMRIDCTEKGSFWTLDINIRNVEDFNRGIWRQSRVRPKQTQATLAGSKLGSTKHGSSNGSKASKSIKSTKGNKIGKNSPKNKRKPVTTSSHGSLNGSIAKLSLASVSKDIDLPSDMMSSNWNIFEASDGNVFTNIVHNDWEDINNLYSGADAEMHPSEDEPKIEPADGGYDSPAASAEFNSKQRLNVRKLHSRGSSPFGLSDGFAKYGNGITPNTSAEELAANVKHTDEEFGIMKDINLEVVGVGISLLPRSDLMSPPDSGSKIRDEHLTNLIDLDDAPIPIDWDM